MEIACPARWKPPKVSRRRSARYLETEEAHVLGRRLEIELPVPARGGIEVPPEGDTERKEFADEDTDTAALAEGRVAPPAPSQDEPA